MPLGTWTQLYVPFADLVQTTEDGKTTLKASDAPVQYSNEQAQAQADQEPTTLWDAP